MRLRYLIDVCGQWDDYIAGKTDDIPPLSVSLAITEIDQLKRFQTRIAKGLTTKDGVTDEMIQQAREYPIDQLIEFDRRGFTCCYHHKEKTPSMKLYKDSNTVHCFGCGYNADTISVLMDRDGYDFLSAVKQLAGQI